MEVHGAAQLPSQTQRRPTKHEWGQVVGIAGESEPEEQTSELSLRCPPGTHATQLLGESEGERSPQTNLQQRQQPLGGSVQASILKLQTRASRVPYKVQCIWVDV